MKTATKQKLILGSCFIAVFLIIMELVILSVNYANLENRLSESQTNLKNTITSMSSEIDSYDSYTIYLENFIKQNVPNAVWTEIGRAHV